MRPMLLGAGSLIAVLVLVSSLPASSPPAPPKSGAVDFETQIRPILNARCQPCHFAGGKMYEKLPFDRPQTLRSLGEKKLFTRIRDPKDQALLRSFLAQEAPPKKGSSG